MSEVHIRSDMVVELVESSGDDVSIARAAMVSTGKTENPTQEKVAGLINALLRERHGTPFEHGFMTFYVEAPIFVFREWHRHRVGFSYNEESARYRKQMTPDFWVPDSGRLLVKGGTAMRPEFARGTEEQYDSTIAALKESYESSWAHYKSILVDGVANEVARACLPVGLYSRMYVSCNPRSLMHFLSLRTGVLGAKFPSRPQREIEQCAEKMESIFASRFPVTHTAFNTCGRVAP